MLFAYGRVHAAFPVARPARWLSPHPPLRIDANTGRRENLARARELLNVAPIVAESNADTAGESAQPTFVCPDCGAAMIVIEILARKQMIRAPPQHRGAP